MSKNRICEEQNAEFLDLYRYVIKHDFMGYDPFDGLNTPLFKLPLLRDNDIVKLCWLQLNKVMPVNLRRFFLIPIEFNVKAGALFLDGFLNLYDPEKNKEFLSEIRGLLDRILSYKIKTSSGIGFGYGFDWKARAFFVPRGTPNAVVTAYVGKSLISYAKNLGEGVECELDGIKDFFLSDMKGFEDDNRMWFYYVPGKNVMVHNANLLVASFLSGYYNIRDKDSEKIRAAVSKAVSFSINDINPDFSWPYGTSSFHRWVDNFHTAFNIEALLDISSVFPELDLTNTINGVLEYYIKNLFDREGTPKYYDRRRYPIDIHVLAQTKILLNRIVKGKNRICVDWARISQIEKKNNEWIRRFRDREGYFYYRKNRLYWNKIPYMRWAQAWMFYALSVDLK